MHDHLYDLVKHTPLQYSQRLSECFDAQIYLKREDLQEVRSYKIRGAYNFLLHLSAAERAHGVVTASAGNHAQGIAQAAAKLRIVATIFVPTTTPQQKLERIRYFGRNYVSIKVIGNDYDTCANSAQAYAQRTKLVFVPPFDHPDIIHGQASVTTEILEDTPSPAWIICPIGGGGLCAGVAQTLEQTAIETRIMAVEPLGAASMKESLAAGYPVQLKSIDGFVDGAAVKRVGAKTFAILQRTLAAVYTVNNTVLCQAMIDLYQHEGIVTEPAGALSVGVLNTVREVIRGQTIVCIISGGNNDLTRYPDILARAAMSNET